MNRTDDDRYRCWDSMKQRCDNPDNPKYKYYGAKGVTYDPRWREFWHFCADVGPRPREHSLDRHPDKEGNYEKSNVRWASIEEQNNNRRYQAEARSDSSTGILGVVNVTGRGYRAVGRKNGKTTRLYQGWDLDKAISIRKQWEAERDANTESCAQS